jgi:hypothetical protein
VRSAKQASPRTDRLGRAALGGVLGSLIHRQSMWDSFSNLDGVPTMGE